jgi:hypothetical protein
MRLLLLTDKLPLRVHLRYWREVDGDGIPIGRGRAIRYSMGPIAYRGREAMRMKLRLPSRGRLLYVSLSAGWRDVEGSDADQDALWTFLLKLV